MCIRDSTTSVVFFVQLVYLVLHFQLFYIYSVLHLLYVRNDLYLASCIYLRTLAIGLPSVYGTASDRISFVPIIPTSMLCLAYCMHFDHLDC